MKHNGRPVIKASDVRPEHLNLHAGEPVMVACPDCSAWRLLKRGMLTPHRAPARPKLKADPEPLGKHAREAAELADLAKRREERKLTPGQRRPERIPRCPGSAQRFTIDLTTDQWSDNLQRARATRLLEADQDAGQRRSNPVRRKPKLAGPKAVTQMKPGVVTYQETTTELIEHHNQCFACRMNRPCTTRRRLSTKRKTAAAQL